MEFEALVLNSSFAMNDVGICVAGRGCGTQTIGRSIRETDMVNAIRVLSDVAA